MDYFSIAIVDYFSIGIYNVGTKPEHSTGCVLVPSRATENELTQLLLKAQNDHEEIILEVIDCSPGTQLGYDTPCPPELQMC